MSGRISFHPGSAVLSSEVSTTTFPASFCSQIVKIRLIKMMLWNSLQNRRYGNCQNRQEYRTENRTGTENRYSARYFRKALTWNSRPRYANNAITAKASIASMTHMWLSKTVSLKEVQ